jgi:hypothetical protein
MRDDDFFEDPPKNSPNDSWPQLRRDLLLQAGKSGLKDVPDLALAEALVARLHTESA